MKCAIGQYQTRCGKTGCEWGKSFGEWCHDKAVKEGYSKKVMDKQEAEKGFAYTCSVTGRESKLSVSERNEPSWVDIFKNKATKKKTASDKRVQRRKSIHKRSSGICYLCGKPVAFEVMTIEHVIPISKGGGNDLNNLRAAHYECNQAKADKVLAEHLKELEKIASQVA